MFEPNEHNALSSKEQDAEMINSIEHVNELEISRDEVLLRAKANRARDYLKSEQENELADGVGLTNHPVSTIEAKEKTEKTEFLHSTEKETKKKTVIIDQIYRDYRTSDDTSFYFTNYPEKLAFKDNGNKLVTSLNDERISFTMASMAEAKGWKSIKLSGHHDFRREVWIEASMRGIKVSGFTPQERDLKELSNRLERLMHNSIEEQKAQQHKYTKSTIKQYTDSQKEISHAPVQDKAKSTSARGYQGYLIEYGAAPYNNNKENTPNNYYIKLKTDTGEKTVWGIDLKRALEESKAKQGDLVKIEYLGNQPVTVKKFERDNNGKIIGEHEIQTHRNTWNVEKTEKHRVAEAVAEAIIKDKIKDPVIAKSVMEKIQNRLIKRAQEDKLPSIRIYDKNSPSQTKEVERKKPQIERNAERTH